MRCPFCGYEDTQVKDSRPTEDGMAIKRRRFCSACQARFTTFERIQLCELTVIKADGHRESFDREKLSQSIYLATKKRNIPSEKVERIINALQHRLEALGESEITSEQIGMAVMEVLQDLDAVSYVRFASVYQSFNEAKDFQDFIKAHITQEPVPSKLIKENKKEEKESFVLTAPSLK